MAKTFDKGIKMNFAAQIDYADGGVVSKQVLKNDAGNITLFSFDAGEGLTEHTSPYDALVQVLEGQVEISISSEKLTIGKDEAVILPAAIPHALFAPQRMKMLLTMIKG